MGQNRFFSETSHALISVDRWIFSNLYDSSWQWLDLDTFTLIPGRLGADRQQLFPLHKLNSVISFFEITFSNSTKNFVLQDMTTSSAAMEPMAAGECIQNLASDGVQLNSISTGEDCVH